MIRYVTKYSRKITARSPSLFCLSLTLLSILEMSFLLLSSPWLTNHVMRTIQNYLDMSNFSLQELEFLWNTKLVIWKCAILFWIEQNITEKSRSLFKKSRYERMCDLKNCFKQKISKQINACMKSVLTKLSMLCTILSIYICLISYSNLFYPLFERSMLLERWFFFWNSIQKSTLFSCLCVRWRKHFEWWTISF